MVFEVYRPTTGMKHVARAAESLPSSPIVLDVPRRI